MFEMFTVQRFSVRLTGVHIALFLGALREGRRGREGECGRNASSVTSLLFNHKAEPALSPKVRVFSEENNGFISFFDITP